VPGTPAHHDIVVTNNIVARSNVMLLDPTPTGLTFASATAPCAGGFPCALGTLAVGASVTVTARFNVPPAYLTPNPVSNTATVTTTINDHVPANNTSTVMTPVGPAADVRITKLGPATILPGDTIVYTTTVFNDGPSTALNVVVTDPTPAGLTFVSNSGDCVTAFPCNFGTMAPNTSRVITSSYLDAAALHVAGSGREHRVGHLDDA
jgi:uncharacterized repeat protein (TIGR01451 family)